MTKVSNFIKEVTARLKGDEAGVVAAIPDRGDQRQHGKQTDRLGNGHAARPCEGRRDQQQSADFEQRNLAQPIAEGAKLGFG